MEQLADLAILEGAPQDTLCRLAELLETTEATPGEVLGEEGRPGDHFWLVLSGELEVRRRANSGSEEVLARAGPGAILGELALLRHAPRSATVVALTSCRLALGGSQALEVLLSAPAVWARLRRLASDRLAHDLVPVRATVANGEPVWVRPLLPEDADAFYAEIRRMSADSLRRRFFSPGQPSRALIDYLVHLDYVDHFAWVALGGPSGNEGMGSARFVRSAGQPLAEMAFGTAERHQGKGVATLLFGALGVAASAAGVSTLFAHVLLDNEPMLRVFAKAGASLRFDEPGVLVAEADPRAAAALLSPQLRAELAQAVTDVVTAASLALTGPKA